jgi:hypothetical protein
MSLEAGTAEGFSIMLVLIFVSHVTVHSLSYTVSWA